MSQPTVQYEKNAELFADYQTPYKLNRPILAPSGEPGDFDALGVDNMRIFRHKGRFYATYIGFDGVGYQTALAVSDDLIELQKLGVIFPRGSANAWDRVGRAVSCWLHDVDLYGNRELIAKDGKYWMFYHAYPAEGYETGSAANGLAWTSNDSFREWNFLDRPVFQKGADGEWDGNYEKDLSSAAEYLVSKGYLCVSVSYRKYPNSKIKDSVEDVMRALYWVKNNAVKYGGDPKRIGVVGVGGGGYLAEMLAVKSTQSRSGDVNPVLGSVSAVVAIGSPSDVYNYGVLVGSERVERDLGSDSSQKGVFEGGVADFSPISQVGSYTPPILLIHADNDYVVPCELSERMKLESDARSAKVEFKTIDSDEHRIWMSPADSYNISPPIWDEVSLFLANKMKVQ